MRQRQRGRNLRALATALGVAVLGAIAWQLGWLLGGPPEPLLLAEAWGNLPPGSVMSRNMVTQHHPLYYIIVRLQQGHRPQWLMVPASLRQQQPALLAGYRPIRSWADTLAWHVAPRQLPPDSLATLLPDARSAWWPALAADSLYRSLDTRTCRYAWLPGQFWRTARLPQVGRLYASMAAVRLHLHGQGYVPAPEGAVVQQWELLELAADE